MAAANWRATTTKECDFADLSNRAICQPHEFPKSRFILAGLFVGFLFLRRQRQLVDPLIDLSLLRIPTFNVSLAVNISAVFVAFGYGLFIAQYLQLVLGLSPLQGGLASLPSAVGFVAGSNLAPRFIYRFRPAFVLGATLALAAIGLVVLTQAGLSGGLPTVITASIITSLALAPVFSLTTELIVGSAPPERAGAASGISETAAELGGALGIAILGSIGTAVYRSQLSTRLPAAVPAEAAEIARDTLGAAVGVARQLPDEIGLTLLTIARDAFVQGMHLSAAISAVVAIVAAIMALILLRRVPARSEVEAESELEPEGTATHSPAVEKVLGSHTTTPESG